MLGVVGTRTLPRRHRQAIARVLVSALVASLPLLYVSLLRPPPSALAGDTAFWFLMSNCVIVAIVATADDGAGTLFFGSSNNDDPPDTSVVPLAVDEPATFVTMKGGGVHEEVAGNNPMGLVASPFLIQAEGADAELNKPGTDMPSLHVSALHVHQDERHETAIEPSTDQNNTALASPTLAPDEATPVAVNKLAIVEADKALTTEPEAEPEPWAAPKLLTSKSLPDQEVQEEDEATDEEWPPDVLAHGKGGRLRRSATDGSKSSAEESEYWKLSDEELNRRVEDFIARFNRQMIEQEAGV